MRDIVSASELLNQRARKTIGRDVAPTAIPVVADRAGVMRVISLKDVRSTPVRWLWRYYLPLGKLAVLDGNPGQGKSTAAIHIAALLSIGAAMPDGTRGLPPADTIIITYEDDAADTLRPRLEAAGGNPARVHHVEGVSYNGDTLLLPPSLPKDLAALEQLLNDRPDVRFVIIDPLSAALGEDVDSHKDQSVRRVLSRLARMAADRNVCILIIRHVRKSHGGNAITAGGGSIGIIGQARVGLLVDRHPEDEQAAVLAVVKSNVGPLAPSLTFRKLVTNVTTEDGELIETSRLEWSGAASITADELLSSREDGSVGEGKDAADWLRAVLESGRVERKQLVRSGEAAGFAERTIDRVAKRIGVVKSRDGFGAEMRSYWSLPFATSSATKSQFSQAPTLTEVGGTGESGGTAPIRGSVQPGSETERLLLARLDRERIEDNDAA